MNSNLAHEMRLMLAGIPFVNVLAGLVRTLEYSEVLEDGSGKTIVKRMPVTDDFDKQLFPCDKEINLVPNSANKGMIYFEDGGINEIKKTQYGIHFKSRIFLVCWVNKKLLFNDAYAPVIGQMELYVINALNTSNPVNVGIFTGLEMSASRIVEQQKGTFSKYSYDEKTTQYLRPPFDFFEIQFDANYYVNNACLEQLEIVNSNCQL